MPRLPKDISGTETYSSQVRIVITLSVVVAFVLAFLMLGSTVGNSAGILAAVPVFVAAWLFGLRGALLGGLLHFPLILLLVVVAGDGDWKLWLREGGVLGTGALLIVGTVVGHLRDLSVRGKGELSRRKQAEEALLQSQKLETVGSLAVGMAHEFNNLLTVILGYSQMAMADLSTEDSQKRADLEEVQTAANRGTDLVRQLQAFSRRQVIEPMVLSLNELILNMDSMLRRFIGEDIELVMLPSPRLGLVNVDAGQIEHVLVNLAVNARDAMPTGGKLTFETADVVLDQDYARLHPGMTAGEYVRLTVRDNGLGMTEEVKAHVFEPFFTTKDVGKGPGLGLATCHGIVKHSGGHIEVHSQLGQGTTFEIYLPRERIGDNGRTQSDDSRNIPVGTETILLAEDEPSMSRLAALVLQQQGYTVLEAANGDHALTVAQEYSGKQIDLLLSDVVMPQMGGVELANRFRTLYPHAKVLLMSGYTDETIVRHGALSHDTEFIPKPFTPAALAHTVKAVLKSNGGGRVVTRAI